MDYRARITAGIGLLTLLLSSLFAVVVEAERAAAGDPTWLPYVADTPALTAVFYDNVVSLVEFVLSPVLVFVVGFLTGRRLDLTREYRGVVSALLLGSLLGYTVGRTGAILLTFGTDLPVTALLGLLLPALVIGTARAVLAGFAGAALGFLLAREPRETSTDRTGTGSAP
jgi:O-antigen ligase